MRQLLSLALGRHRADIVEAGDGLSALKELAKRKFDLMLVDLNMPVLDGMKLIRRVRDDPAIASMKICVVTTEAAEAVEQQARALGADFYLRKPVAPQGRRAHLRRSVSRLSVGCLACRRGRRCKFASPRWPT